MNTKVSRIGGIRIVAALIGAICAGTAGAQQQLDTQNLPASRVQAASCAEVAWDEELLALYPRIAEGCQEVLISEGEKWARFDADFASSDTRDGTVTLNFKNRAGNPMGNVTLKPAPEQRVSIDGRSYRFSELTRGQQLNVYIPERMFAVAIEPGAPPEQLAQIVVEPTRLAQADPAPTQVAQQLPSTAGPLPLFLLAGLASLLSGLGLAVRRRFTAKGITS